MRSRRAFTLIELLAVISIIAILAALLVPTVKNVREKGQEASCLSNMRELAIACVIYSTENEGKFPYDSTSSGWHSRIYEYVGAEGTPQGWNGSTAGKMQKNRYYLCSMDKDPYRGGYDYGVLSYGFNRKFRPGGNPAPADPRRHSLAKSAVMLAESSNVSFDETTNQPVEYRHRKGANFAYTDGRVEWHLPADVTSEFLSLQY